MTIALFFVLVVAVAGVGTAGVWVLRTELSGLQGALREFPRRELDALAEDLHNLRASVVKLEAQVDQLPSTWEEMHQKVRRTEERTRGAVRRALKELEEDGLRSEELEGIADDVGVRNGGGGPPGGVHAMHPGMGHVPPQAPQGPPQDWRQRGLAQKFGGR